MALASFTVGFPLSRLFVCACVRLQLHGASGRLRARLRHTEALLAAARRHALELEFELVALGVPRPWELTAADPLAPPPSRRLAKSRLGAWPDAPPPPPGAPTSAAATEYTSPAAAATAGRQGLPVEPTGPGARPGSSVNQTSALGSGFGGGSGGGSGGGAAEFSLLSAETAARAAALHAERLGWCADGLNDVPPDPDEDGGGGSSSFGSGEGSAAAVAEATAAARAAARALAAAARVGARVEAWLAEKYAWEEATGELVRGPP
jgi:hypothetical protein